MFYPLMAPLLHSRLVAWSFLLIMVLLTFGAMGLAAMRSVPLKMLPFDNKNELLLVLDFDKGTTLERSDAAVRDFEAYLAGVPEVSDYTSYVGLASPMDFNGLVRHYYLRHGDDVAEVRIDLAGKKNRRLQSHAIGLRMRHELQAIADRHRARMKLVETPPGPPVIASVVAESLRPARQQLRKHPGGRRHRPRATGRRAGRRRHRFRPRSGPAKTHLRHRQGKGGSKRHHHRADRQHAAAALEGSTAGLMRSETERNPLRIELRVPVELRSSAAELGRIQVQGSGGQLVPLAELGHWDRQPRGSDDLPQGPASRGLRLRRNRRAAARRRGRST